MVLRALDALVLGGIPWYDIPTAFFETNMSLVASQDCCWCSGPS